ncbi:hypothetical protein [Coleofasciculus sp. FACHB-501]|uniref:hypothetical protein n=1 Tax=Cyanophyceae TaxID=3028117 RepID=UPI001683034E|nr:hypothetical protein [Coleofasciculus sp. FACHB-501]MBD1836658.1 hypothetical protein [Coleofasciculus sp. FACHB-501]
MSEQHYRLTLEDAIAKYSSGDITAKGLLHFYILIKCKPGWKLRLEQSRVCSELGIQKSAFYSAISRLREEGSIDWEAPKGIVVSLSTSGVFRECGKNSTIAETESTITEIESAITETESAIAEKKSPKPSSERESSNSPSSYQSSYQLFINSLSEGERVDFCEFGRKKASQLPHPPELPDKWIAANWEELKRQWKPPAKPCRDFSQHPQRGEWLDKIRTLGAGAFVFESGSRDQERSDFLDWADTSKLIWGQES